MLRNTMKKGNMTFQQIVTAIIALVILIVLIMIFTGKMSLINDDIESCQSRGGTCVPNECPVGALEKFGEFSECTSTEKCCVVIFLDNTLEEN